ncbi:SET domain-containing protein 4 isoform X2 [Microcaecilia unicolor]|nr:SET domain-containing protein 4 isoform X2 [Microcaecilia unicolor]XP_030058058.1 SET domain-containing protein 4 isoform X2 [Microcaecilia unicolor]XP_030058059.1 SET domain-containing protein 4 isoform X2 [Microcaecilia unicolor]XP_030058060.1 SET domain-containing protein 4 isoform X2 [Microcaecilia unicolor]XP_030058061.1 SET domain-containing protein 4 isoform X2 [Microcaecilia unicolor]XP_030058062.1 SET domain-containing protein 4 isoform X2 [Microcaecilia unicolor]XP_030058063.1 SE
MKKQRGRTGRHRRRKLGRRSALGAVNYSHEPEYIQIKKWLKERGFDDSNLKITHFTDTGRGLVTTKSIQAGDIIISLPEKCLLTTSTVLGSYLGKYITEWKPPVSPLLAICTFLIVEKYAGDLSIWKPYLDVLPQSYTCPVYWEPEVETLLPEPLRRKAQEQRTVAQELYQSSKLFFTSLQSLFSQSVDSVFTFEALRWAWCTVNTRTVYMKNSQSPCFSNKPDVYVLAPYLDLLNHSPVVQVKAAFNEKNRCYEIIAGSNCRKHEQVFICYGPHDNQRLLLEYGFVASRNPHSSVFVSTDVLLHHVSPTDKQIPKKLSLLKEHNFLENLTFGRDGPSWKLLTAVKLLCLGSGEFMCWKKVLLGETVSDINEQNSLALVRNLCYHLIEETHDALRKLSLLKSERMDLEQHLALVETLRREELQILQASTEIIMQNLHSEAISVAHIALHS